MQGLRPLQAHQDENSGFIARGNGPAKVFGGEENRGGGLAGMKTPKAGLASARKALGNITNRGFDASNLLPGKTPAGSVARKPLGTVTNGAGPRGAEAATQCAPADDRAARLAQDGVERLAGMGWEELEAEREAREDAEIADRLTAMAALGRRNLPTYYPHWAVPPSAPPAPLRREAVADTLPSPEKRSRASSLCLDVLDDELGVDALPAVGGADADELPLP